MTTTPAGARIVGTLHRTQDGKGAVRMEDVYDTDIDNLWSALTDPRRLARWVADVEGEFRLGGRIHARFTSSWDGPGRIDVCQAPSRLTVTLSPDEPDETVIDATLVAEQDKTRLVIEESGIPLNVLPGYGAGWQAHVEDLTAYVEGRETTDWHARWSELVPTYQAVVIDPA
jgi:uncharacterized protein YndB with AHSA1/START domain